MIGSDGREIYRVVWPRGARTVQASDVAPRLSTLEGKTIGQLWDYLFRGDEIFPMLEEELADRFPGVRFVGYDTFGSTHGGDEQRVLAELPAQAQGAGGRRGHLGDGLLRELHARRVAGECGGRAGRRADRVAGVRGLPRPGGDHRHRPRAARTCRRRSCPATSTCRATRSSRRNVAAVTVGRGDPEPHRSATAAGGRGRRARPRRHRLRGQPRRGQSLLLRERLERRPADRAADARARRGVPALLPIAPGETELGRAAARQARARPCGRWRSTA